MTTCKHCHTVLPKNVRVCPQCGQTVNDATDDKILPKIVLIPQSEDPNATLISSDDSLENALAESQPPVVGDAPAPVNPTEWEDQDTPPLGYVFPLAGAANVAPAPAAGAPVVPGTPPIGNVPSVPGTPDLSANAGPTPQAFSSDDGQLHVAHVQHPGSPQLHGTLNTPQQPELPDLHQQVQGGHAAHELSDLAHSLHQQPKLEPQGFLQHEQPDASHALHQQAPDLHAQHAQPAPAHGLHQQPAPTHAAHIQPQAMHAAHQQTPATVQHGEKATRGCRLSCGQTVLATAGLVIVAIIALVVKTTFFSGAAAPPPGLAVAGSAFPGGSVLLQGSHFAANSTISLTVDNQPLAGGNQSAAIASKQPPPEPDSLLGIAQMLRHQTPLSGTPVVIAADGTFSKIIHIAADWPVGSKHVIGIYDQSGAFVMNKDLVVVTDTTPRLAPCSQGATMTTMHLGPLAPGQTLTSPLPFQLCTQGQGTVKWLGSWDQHQAPWLTISQTSGQTNAPQSQQISVGASAAGLKPGIYTTSVVFTNGLNQITLDVTLVVQAPPTTPATNPLSPLTGATTLPPGTTTPAPAVPCISTTSQGLTFTTQQGQGDPAGQALTITNCGKAAGAWLANTVTDSGGGWLSTTPTNGLLAAGANQSVGVNVANVGLVAGTYTGHISLSIGTGTVTVNVTVHVTLAPICLQSNTGGLTFTSPNRATPGAQTVTLTNPCAPGGWTAATDVGWIATTPGSGTLGTNASANVSIAVDLTGVSTGTHTGHITFTGGASVVTVTVTLFIQVQPPCLTPANLGTRTLTAVQGGASPAPQPVTINNGAGCGAGPWTATTSAGWLSTSSANGQIAAGGNISPTIAISTAGLTARDASYVGQVVFQAGTTTAILTVNLTIQTPPPCIAVNPGTLTFTEARAPAGGASGGDFIRFGSGNSAGSASFRADSSTDAQAVTLNNPGPCGTANWAADVPDQPWLSVSPTSGSLATNGSVPLSVTVNAVNLATGQYTGHITFVAGARSTTLTVQVVVQAPPCFNAPGILNFSATQNGADPPAQPLQITNGANCGPGSLSIRSDQPWLSVANVPGQIATGGTATVNVVVHSSQLGSGQQTGFLFISAAGVLQAETQVNLNVQTAQACIAVDPTSLSFTETSMPNTAPSGGGGGGNAPPSNGGGFGDTSPVTGNPVATAKNGHTSFFARQALPMAGSDSQSVTLTDPGPCGGTNWTASSDADWLSASPTGGAITSNGSATVTIQVAFSSLNAGTYKGNITFTGGAHNVVLPVTLTIKPPALACISVNPTTLNFNATTADPPAQAVTISNDSDCGAGNWSASSDSGWLTVSPTSGPIAGGEKVSANINASFSYFEGGQGTHSGTVTFTDGVNTSVVKVTFTIANPGESGVIPPSGIRPFVPKLATTPTPTPKPTSAAKIVDVPTPTPPPAPVRPACLKASVGSLAFRSTTSGTTSQGVSIKNCGDAGIVSATTTGESWLSVNGGGGVGVEGQMDFTVNATNRELTPDTYTGSVTFTITTSTGAKSVTLPVMFTVATIPTPTVVPTPTPTPTAVPTASPTSESKPPKSGK